MHSRKNREFLAVPQSSAVFDCYSRNLQRNHECSRIFRFFTTSLVYSRGLQFSNILTIISRGVHGKSTSRYSRISWLFIDDTCGFLRVFSVYLSLLLAEVEKIPTPVFNDFRWFRGLLRLIAEVAIKAQVFAGFAVSSRHCAISFPHYFFYLSDFQRDCNYSRFFAKVGNNPTNASVRDFVFSCSYSRSVRGIRSFC